MNTVPQISDFVILKPISRGAFGKVYLGVKKSHPEKKYAIKVMKKSDMIHKNMVAQVIAERNALALSKSPFVVTIYYSLQSRENIYLVMDYLIGGDVKSLLAVYGYFDEDMAVLYTAEVALALEYLHSHGIVHRDLKPDNMLVAADGHLKLTDFGLSTVTLRRAIQLSDILTTPSMVRPFSRTPGQLLSLTSCLAFGNTGAKPDVVAMTTGSRQTTQNQNRHNQRVTFKNASSPSREFLAPSVFRSSMSRMTESSRVVGSVEKACEEGSLGSSIIHQSPIIAQSSPFVESPQSMSGELLQPCVLDANFSSGGEDSVFLNDEDRAMHVDDREIVPSLDNYLLLDLNSSIIGDSRCHSTESAEDGRQECSTEILESKHHSLYESIVNSSFGSIELVRRADTRCHRNSSSGCLPSTLLTGDNTFGCGEMSSSMSGPGDMHLFAKENQGIQSLEMSSLALSPSLTPDRCRQPWIAGRKRQFIDVEKSPVGRPMLTKASLVSGLTLDIQALSVEQPAKRVLREIQNEISGGRSSIRRSSSGDLVFSSPRRSSCQTQSLLVRGDSVDSLKQLINRGAMQKAGEGRLLSYSMLSSHSRVDGSGMLHTHVDLMSASSSENGEGGVKETVICESQPPAAATAAAGGSSQQPLPAHQRKQTHFLTLPSSTSDEPKASSSRSSSATTGITSPAPSTADIRRLHFMTPLVTPCRKFATPLRTPRSVRRGQQHEPDGRILGTPDYLAPELLLQECHGPAVDWWALGVCLFEFLTGVPPFNDETPEAVFKNILDRDIPWPMGEEALSKAARNAVEGLLTIDPNQRLMSPELKGHSLFSKIDWHNIHDVVPKFIPSPEDDEDTSYFDVRNTLHNFNMSSVDM